MNHEFFEEYADKVAIGFSQAARSREFKNLIKLLTQARIDGTPIFVAGNGGSASICEHMQCDWLKGVGAVTKNPLDVHSLVSNTALLTAIGNDYGYQHVFSSQLRLHGISNAITLLISSSGNSPNIIEAIKQAKELEHTVVGFSGFDGGKLKKKSDISIHVPIHNYGVVEDVHQMLMHSIAQHMIAKS